ncbi:MAG: hypothetical protein ABUK17_11340, partial [Syntrophobacteria bacterium]
VNLRMIRVGGEGKGSEGSRQEADGSGQKTESRSQKSEVRDQLRDSTVGEAFSRDVATSTVLTISTISTIYPLLLTPDTRHLKPL